jgi:hypothetical protein
MGDQAWTLHEVSVESYGARSKFMAMLSNPTAYAIRLVLSDGTARIIGPWGLALVPEYGQRGQRLEITTTELADVSVPVEAQPARPRAA